MERRWLTELRKIRHLSHDEVAYLSGIGRSYYTRIESGTRNPSVDVARRIAQVIGFEWTLFFEHMVPSRNKKEEQNA